MKAKLSRGENKRAIVPPSGGIARPAQNITDYVRHAHFVVRGLITETGNALNYTSSGAPPTSVPGGRDVTQTLKAFGAGQIGMTGTLEITQVITGAWASGIDGIVFYNVLGEDDDGLSLVAEGRGNSPMGNVEVGMEGIAFVRLWPLDMVSMPESFGEDVPSYDRMEEQVLQLSVGGTYEPVIIVNWYRIVSDTLAYSHREGVTTTVDALISAVQAVRY